MFTLSHSHTAWVTGLADVAYIKRFLLNFFLFTFSQSTVPCPRPRSAPRRLRGCLREAPMPGPGCPGRALRASSLMPGQQAEFLQGSPAGALQLSGAACSCARHVRYLCHCREAGSGAGRDRLLRSWPRRGPPSPGCRAKPVRMARTVSRLRNYPPARMALRVSKL